jgi:hypothetical protein
VGRREGLDCGEKRGDFFNLGNCIVIGCVKGIILSL